MNSKFMRCAFAYWLNFEWNVTTQDDYYLSNKSNIFLTPIEVAARLRKDYTADINAFDMVQPEILKMSNFFVNGIVMQFPSLFCENMRFYY